MFLAQFALPPIPFYGVDQAPIQHLDFPLYGPSLEVARSFIVVHSTADPLVECSYIVIVST